MTLRKAGLSAMLALVFASSAAAEDKAKSFTLLIGDKSVQIDVGDSVPVTLSDGTKLEVSLARNEFATFKAEAVAFVHPGDLSVASTVVGKGITQHLAASALGTVLIVQDYTTINPDGLAQIMVNELTETDVAAGGKLGVSPATRTLSDGKTLKGLAGSVSLKDGIKHFEVETYGKDGRGFVAISMIADDNRAAEQKNVDRFWETLTYTPE